MQFTDAPLEAFGEGLLNITVPSKLGFKTPLVFRCLKLLKENGYLPATGTHMAELCFEEILANSIIHGNQMDENKDLTVQLFGDGQKWGMIVEDEGVGLSSEHVPDPDDPESLLADRGRGIMLVKQFVDDLTYNRKGNKVMLVRAAQTESAAPSVAAATSATAVESTEGYEPKVGFGESLSKVSIPDDIELDLVEDELPVSGDGLVAMRVDAGVRVVTIQTDRLTEDNAGVVQDTLYPALEGDEPVALDLSQLQFLSSKGISLILAANKRVMQSKRKCVLAGTTAAVFDILKATGLVKLLRFEDTTEGAVKALQG